MFNLLKVVLGAGCGLAGVGAIIFYSIQKNWLQIKIFSVMTPEQTYNAFLISIGLSFLALICLIIAHLFSKKNPSISTTAQSSGHAVTTTGKNSSVTIGK